MDVRIRGLTGTAMVSVYRMSRSAMERVEMASGIVMLMIPALPLVILVMGPVVLGIYDVLIAGRLCLDIIGCSTVALLCVVFVV